jgi:peptidoglycan/LPS O-acetylase OafA/YrhL
VAGDDPSPVTLADYLDRRPTGLDVLRLVLALAVLVSHTWVLGGFGSEPKSPLTPRYLTLGGFAVGGFFALSGLLVGRSAQRRDTWSFARARIRRIVPAYWAALVVSAFGAGLAGWIHEGHGLRAFFTFGPEGPFAYVGRAALFPVQFSHGILQTFASSTPYGRATGTSWINGSLWTLPYEVRCYVLIAGLAAIGRRLGARRALLAGWLLCAVAAAAYHWRPDLTRFVLEPVADAQLVALAFVFLTGAVVAMHADRIRLIGPVPAIALVVGVLAGLRSPFFAEHIGNASLALVLPVVASFLDDVGESLNGIDLSYGVYLYAWPVQQLIAQHRWASSPGAFIVMSAVGAGLLASASWYAIEAPLLRSRP